MPQPSATERELQALAAQLKKLETEYNMYFAGRSGRPPLDSRAAIDRAFKRFDRTSIDSPVARFQFSTLQARYSSFCDLWDRGVRAREEGRGGPFHRPAAETPHASRGDEVIHAASFQDPVQEMDKLRDLYEAVMQARRDEGRDAVPFHKFAALVRDQVRTLRERHPGDEVWFRVARHDGTINLRAQAVKPAPREDPDA